MIRMIIFLLFLLLLRGLCVKVTNNNKYFVPNHQDCGLRSVNSSDQRTLHPWTVAVYTRQSSTSPWRYLVTGAVISPTTVVSVFEGGFGQPPQGGEPGQKYKIPSPKNLMVVGGLTTTDLLEADANAQYAPVSYTAPCINSKDWNNEDYHVVIIRLTKPFNISTSYVRPICVPFATAPTFENFTVETKQEGMMTGFYSPHGQGFYSQGGNNEPNYASITASAFAYDEERCENYAKRSDYLFCGQLTPNGILKDDVCLTYGTAGVWKSTETVINFDPSFGPIPRFFVFAILAELGEGHCDVYSTLISDPLRGVYDHIKGHLKCPATTFPCPLEDRCIELSSVCDGIKDCGNGEDENPTFCKATSECDLGNEYQCGLYGKCIEKNRTLDGTQDCPSGNDENPELSMAPSSRNDVESQTHCNQFWLVDKGVQANCTDALGQQINCTDAVPSTETTLTCAPNYQATQRTSVVSTCYEDGDWKPQRSISCEPGCGLWVEYLQGKSSVGNGKEVEDATRLPWHVLIFRRNETSNSYEYICAGSLIERNVILTAANCTVDARGDPVKPKMFKIIIRDTSTNFEDYSSDESENFQVKKIWRPSSFDSRTLKSDIAIFQLKSRIDYNEYIRPICYSTEKIDRPRAPNSSGIVSGFGSTKTGKMSADLKLFELNVTEINDCGMTASLDKFCAKVSGVGDKNLCYGHNGGAGIIFPAEDNEPGAYVLKGIVSIVEHGPGGCGKGHSAMSFTPLDLHTEWLVSIIKDIDTSQEEQEDDSDDEEQHDEEDD